MKIRVAGIDENDMANGEGICVSLFLQGCHFHCKGCQNPETWSFCMGTEWDTDKLIEHILELLNANGIQHNLSLLGGEPFDTDDKVEFLSNLIKKAKEKYPTIKIYAWSGYWYEDLLQMEDMKYILDNIDYLIEGPFVLAQRDITLKWRGSTNQHIRNMKTGQIED